MKKFLSLSGLALIFGLQISSSVAQTCTTPTVTADGSTAICRGGSVTLSAPAGDVWLEKANFGGTAREKAVGFSIGNKGYIGTGYNNSGFQNDFWEYDPSLDVWTQKANFAGSPRRDAVAFSIGNKGYIGTGLDWSGPRNDFWEYDPSSNTWTQKANVGGAVRNGAAGFSIGAKGYIGTGRDNYLNYLKDFWEYDPSADTWTQKANFGGTYPNGTARYYATGFSIYNKGYIGTGTDASHDYLSSFFEYDPMSDIWTKKTDFAGTSRNTATGFSIGGRGYIGAGFDMTSNTNDFWEYDPALNSWSQIAYFGGVARSGAVGFSINGKGYRGLGLDNSYAYTGDFWEYDPSLIYSWSPVGATSPTLVVTKPGTYVLTITNNAEGCVAVSAPVTVTVSDPPIITTTLEGNVLTANQPGASYQWYDCTTKTIIDGATSSSYAVIADGYYAVIITLNTCIDTSACTHIFTTGVDQTIANNNRLLVYPNPNNGSFVIQSNLEGVYTLQNELGQTIQNVILNNSNNYQMGLDNLRNGIYFVVGQNNKTITRQKVIVTN